MTITIMTGILVAFFLFASSIKLLGWQRFIFNTQLEFFHKYGLNRQVMFLVGMIELSGALLLLLSLGLKETVWALPTGALLLGLTSLGAIGFHLRFDTWKDAIPAAVTLFLSGGLLMLSDLSMSLLR